jgi:hypothetical protein
MDYANDNETLVAKRKRRVLLALPIIASLALWLMQGIWVWRVFFL